MHHGTIQNLMDLGLDWPWPSTSLLIYKPIFLTNWLSLSLLWCQSQILMSSWSTRVITKTMFYLLQHSASFIECGEHSPPVYYYLVLNIALGSWGYFDMSHHSSWEFWSSIEYHIHIWHMSPQLSCRDTWELSMWLKNLTDTFIWMNLSLMKKLRNITLVTPTHDLKILNDCK